MGLGTLGVMHNGSINFINDIISLVTTKIANRQAPSGLVSPDCRISQQNLAHKHKHRHTHTRSCTNIKYALSLTRTSAQRGSGQVDATEMGM